MPIFDVKIAANGRTWLTVEANLVDGTYKRVSPTDGTVFDQDIPVLVYEDVCGKPGEEKKTQIKFRAAYDWPESNVGEGTVQDSTVWYRVLEMPTCENNLVGKFQIQDTTTADESCCKNCQANSSFI